MVGATGPATRAEKAAAPLPAHHCPECGSAFLPSHPRQLFCSPAHQQEWKQRTLQRGFQLLPFAIPARLTRGGTRGDIATGRRALADMDMLIGRWRDEDAAKGRMSAAEYLAHRYRLGFDRP